MVKMHLCILQHLLFLFSLWSFSIQQVRFIHSVDSTEKVNRRLRKMDHMMIFVMIAGSYTPICLIALHNRTGYILCALCMEYRNPRYSSQRIMDHMSQMAFFRTLYWNGMALCTCFRSYLSFPSASRIWMASCRWYHLYDRWCDL